MPGYDGMGPRGTGPMTGGGRGYCAIPADDYTPRPRLGRQQGRGGRGRRNQYYATGMPGWQRAVYRDPVYGAGVSSYPEPTIDEEKAMLKNEAEALKKELENIQNRLKVLGKDQG
jgi:uncharacterized protein DUF5320